MKKWWFRGDFLLPNGLWLGVITHIVNTIGLITNSHITSIIGHTIFSIIAFITVILAIRHPENI